MASEQPFQVVGEPKRDPPWAPERVAGARVIELALRALALRSLELLAILIGAGIAGVAVWEPTILRLMVGVGWAVLVIIPLLWRSKRHE